MSATDGFDPRTYGDGFADVYDEWYPPDASTDAAVEAIASRASGIARRSPAEDRPDDRADTARILELGVGTGRLALPLARRGLDVTGMDASPAMLERLASRLGGASPDRGLHPGRLVTLLGDVEDRSSWPSGPFEVVVAACNLVCNLADPAAQRAMFDAASSVLVDGGWLAVEAFVPARLERRERRVELRSVSADVVTLIATDADPDTGEVVGSHIELRDGEPVRLRPWRIVAASPDQLDRWATDAGLAPTHRHAGWADEPVGDAPASMVHWYRRRPT